MKIPYNILIQIKMSVRPYFKGFTLIFFFYNCRKQDYTIISHSFVFNFYYLSAQTGIHSRQVCVFPPAFRIRQHKKTHKHPSFFIHMS